jgi:ankyrin repeat protein
LRGHLLSARDIAAYLRAQGAQLDIFRAAFIGDQAPVARDLDADPALLHAEDPCDSIYFMPLLAFAVAGGHVAVVDFLLQRGVAVGSYSALLLYLAARASRLDLVKLLVTHGAEVRAVDASIFGAVADLPMIRYLLDHGALATQPGKNGFPALTYVVRGDKGERPDKVQLLLEQGEAVNAIGPKGRTALHYAAAAGKIAAVTLLTQRGANQ